jgi:hypothetical protein
VLFSIHGGRSILAAGGAGSFQVVAAMTDDDQLPDVINEKMNSEVLACLIKLGVGAEIFFPSFVRPLP